LKCLVKCDISSIRHAWNEGWFCRLVSFLTCFGLTEICFVPFSSIRFGSFPSWSHRFTVALLGSLIGFRPRSIQIYSHFVVRFVLILFAPIWFRLLLIWSVSLLVWFVWTSLSLVWIWIASVRLRPV
jgi:hypothetical protein